MVPMGAMNFKITKDENTYHRGRRIYWITRSAINGQ